MKDLRDKTAVIVAGGNGIGRAMAHALADTGVNIVVADIRGDAAAQVQAEILAKGGRAVAQQTDASKLDEMERLADVAFSTFGSVEILCNNAGVAVRPFRAVWDTSYADLQYMVGVNVWGLLNGYHVFVPRMREQDGEKHIVNTSSQSAILTYPGTAIYAMTKEGVTGLTRVAGEELRPYGFGYTILYPGLVDTPAAQRSGELRSAEEQTADAKVRPYSSYVEERGGKLTLLEAGRGAMITPVGGEGSQKAISPEAVGRMVVAAILADRQICFTHPIGVDGLKARFGPYWDAYQPDE